MKVGLYARISDDVAGQELGVGRQCKDARRLAEFKGWLVAGEYLDNDLSAFQPKVVRPEFERLLVDLDRGALDGVVVYDLDRFVRKPSDLERAIAIYDARRLVFATVQSDIDLSTPDGRTMARVLVAFANKASMDTSRRTKRKHLELAQAGIPVGSQRPFGYQADKRTLNEPETELIRQAAQDILAGVGLHTICRRWNQAGISTPLGNAWQQPVLKRMMLSPRLAGYRVYQRGIARDDDGRPVMAQRPPILDVATWEAVCALLTAPERAPGHIHRGGRKRLLGGFLRCGNCGSLMIADWYGRGGIHVYACKPVRGGCSKVLVSGPRVDELVTKLVLSYLGKRQLPKRSKAWKGERQLTAAEGRITELMAAYTSGELSGEVVFPAVSKLEKQVTQLKAERSSYLAESATPLADDVLSRWGEMTVDEQRSVIERVLETVVIRPATKAGGRFDPSRCDPVWRTDGQSAASVPPTSGELTLSAS